MPRINQNQGATGFHASNSGATGTPGSGLHIFSFVPSIPPTSPRLDTRPGRAGKLDRNAVRGLLGEGRRMPAAPQKTRKGMTGLTKSDNREQSKLFIQKAREIGADEERSAADELLGHLAKRAPEPKHKKDK